MRKMKRKIIDKKRKIKKINNNNEKEKKLNRGRGKNRKGQNILQKESAVNNSVYLSVSM